MAAEGKGPTRFALEVLEDATDAAAFRTAIGAGTGGVGGVDGISDVPGLVSALANKSDVGHTHTTGDITGFAAAVASALAGTTVEQDLGSTATWRGRFTITDAAITATSKVLCWQAPGPYTGKGTRADEAEMQPVSVVAVEPATGSAVVTWQTPPSYTQELVLPDGRRAAPVALNEQMLFPTLIPKRIGKVRGNVKFSYLILS